MNKSSIRTGIVLIMFFIVYISILVTSIIGAGWIIYHFYHIAFWIGCVIYGGAIAVILTFGLLLLIKDANEYEEPSKEDWKME